MGPTTQVARLPSTSLAHPRGTLGASDDEVRGEALTKRVCGFVAGVVAGVFCGVNMVPYGVK